MTTVRRRPGGSTDQDNEAWALDATDRRIVRELAGQARVSNRQLAERIGIAPSTALVRTQALLDRGVIMGFTADLDLASVGRGVQALVAVQLRAHEREKISSFASRVSGMPEVVATFHTAGATDYLFHVAVPNTATLRNWVFDNLTVDPTVAHVETTLIFNHLPGNASMLPDGY
jgi:DNA-binding Lrp family transcriptional regulator